jgi:hypothetical protein
MCRLEAATEAHATAGSHARTYTRAACNCIGSYRFPLSPSDLNCLEALAAQPGPCATDSKLLGPSRRPGGQVSVLFKLLPSAAATAVKLLRSF